MLTITLSVVIAFVLGAAKTMQKDSTGLRSPTVYAETTRCLR